MASSLKTGRATNTKESCIGELGVEVLRRIFSFLPPISLAYCSAVCSSWYNEINSSSSPWTAAYFLEESTRLKQLPREKIETKDCSTALEKKQQKKEADGDADKEFRTLFVEEEQRTRLFRGQVSTRSWRAHSGRVNCCRMVMGQIVSGSSDRTVRVWCSKTLKCLEQYNVPEQAAVVQVEFDESKVMGAAGKNVLLWSRMGNRRLLRRMGGQSEIRSMCVADSDLAMGCNDGTVRVFDLYSSRCTQIFRLHTQPVKAVVVDMTTQIMVSGSNDGRMQLFDARSGQSIASLLRPSSMTGISCLHLSPQDRKLFAGTMGGSLYCFDLRSQIEFWKIRCGGGALTCLSSPTYSTSTIGVGGFQTGMKIFEVESGARIASFQVRQSRLPCSPVLSMALGMTKLVSCHADWSIIQWQLGESRSTYLDYEDDYGRKVVTAPISP